MTNKAVEATAGGLSDKVAVITGANSGMGLATVHCFMKEGASVVAFDKNIDVVKDITFSVQGDVTNLADLDRLYAEVKEKYGHIDIVFANAGICPMCPYEQTTEESYDRTMDINVKGVFFTVQKAVPLIREHGSIILTGSVGSMKGYSQMSVYCASKASVRSFARSMANELRHRKIRANVISPGGIDTPIMFNSNPQLTMQDFEQMIAASNLQQAIPVGRTGTAEDVANAVYFLASDQSSYINGADLHIDGGMEQI